MPEWSHREMLRVRSRINEPSQRTQPTGHPASILSTNSVSYLKVAGKNLRVNTAGRIEFVQSRSSPPGSSGQDFLRDLDLPRKVENEVLIHSIS